MHFRFPDQYIRILEDNDSIKRELVTAFHLINGLEGSDAIGFHAADIMWRAAKNPQYADCEWMYDRGDPFPEAEKDPGAQHIMANINWAGPAPLGWIPSGISRDEAERVCAA
jgi:hypothetical protein